MIIEQIYTGCLSQGAYYIESNGEAAIIDPLREVDQYILKAKKNKASIKYIFETHFHADFVSGHLTLSKKTNAPIIYGPNANTSFESINAKDGQRFNLGEISIEVLHTPGHTMESSCYLLLDKKNNQIALFSGDTVFMGDVGRPDLAQKSDLSKEDLAGHLYESIHNKILKLDYIYFQRDGAKDEIVNNSKNIIHAVFPQNPFQYHGSKYAFISRWLSKTCSNNKFPFVPLPVKLLKNNQNLRNKLKIPKNAKVFGYHGGETSFDLIFVRDAIKKVVKQNNNIYFLFMNIKKFFNHKKAIFIKGTFNQTQKVKFINTCDAMLHARSLGESFGLSCAEFAIKNKPILTYGYCRQRAHFEICKNNIIPYYSYKDLNTKIINFNKNKKYNSGNLKNELSEKKTIKIFKEIFSKCLNYIMAYKL